MSPSPNPEQEQLSKAFSDQPVDLYGTAELRAQLERIRDQNPSPEAPEAAPDQLGDLAAQAGAEVLGTSWETAQEAHAAATELFSRHGGVPVPELGEFASAGVEFARLKDSYEAMEAAGLRPEFILAPVNLHLQVWQDIYSGLREWQDQNRPSSAFRLKNQSDGDGLWVNDAVKNNWLSLSDQAFNTPGATTMGSDGVVAWKALVVPAASKAEGGLAVNTSYDLSAATLDAQAATIGVDPSSLTPENAHMPIGAYLTLQAEHILQDEPLLDSDTWTWNAGTYDSGSRAPASGWDSDRGQVYVYYVVVGGSDDYVGARLPVWG